MSQHQPPRRQEFDDIAMGWGSDSFDDLTARIELLAEFKIKVGTLWPAEQKTVQAMITRQVAMGVARGEFGPQLP